MLKKLIVLLLVIFSLLGEVYCGEKHAVIITGDYRYRKGEYSKDRYEYKWWNDTVMFWYMLVKEQGYLPENVYVLFAGGEDYTTVMDQVYLDYIPEQYRMDIWEQYDEYGFDYNSDNGHIKHLSYSSASYNNITDIFDSLAIVMSDDDMLFVATIGHGGYVGMPEADPNMDGEMLIWDDNYGTPPVMTDYKFASLIEQVPANKKVFWLSQCFSGTFVDNLEQMNDGSSKIIHTSCQYDEVSKQSDNKAWTGQYIQTGEGIELEHLFNNYQDEYVIHDEFQFHMYTSTTGQRPFGNYDVRPELVGYSKYYQRPSDVADYEWFPISEGDLNSDGIFSAYESSVWMDNYESIDNYIEKEPNYLEWGKFELSDYWYPGQESVYSDLEGVGNSTSLMYPTLILN